MADTSVFLGLEHMNPSLFSPNSAPSHLLAEGMVAGGGGWRLLQRGATYFFTGVQEASVGEGQPKGEAVSPQLHRGL